MIKYICVLLAAGMLVACEKKTETVTPSETSPGADESATTESPAAETSSPTP